MSELYQLTLTEAQQRLRAKEISAVELTKSVIARIQAVEPHVQAYLSLQSEAALRQAETADVRRAQGEDTPLLGIPLGIKDSIATAGVLTTCGSQMLANYVPPFNATVMDRLNEAGAILLGKTNTDEFTMGSSTEYSAFHRTYNPWDTNRVPGGSSGGSAAAVAAGEALATLGTDTGGSIRQPAGLCGVVGLKPTYGRVSRYGLIAHGSSLDQIGPLTRSVADSAAVLSVIAGHDPLDSTTLEHPVPDYLAALQGEAGSAFKGMKIGIPAEYFDTEGMEPGVEAAVRQAIQLAEEAGAIIQPVQLPNTRYGIPVYYLIATAEASSNLARYDGVRYGVRVPTEDMVESFIQTRSQGFGPEVKRRIMLGTYALSAGYYDAYYLKAQKVRTLIKRDFEAAFQQVDVLFAPATPTIAFEMGQKVDDPLQMYLSDIFTVTVNLAGICAMTVPCGFSQGMPVGLQIFGPALGEEKILKAGHAYQQLTDWHQKRPSVG